MIYFKFVNIFKLQENFFILVWNFCEFFHINIGNFAPYVFGKAVGKKDI